MATYVLFQQQCGRSVKLTIRLRLAPRLRTSGPTSLRLTCSHGVETVFIYLLMAPFGDGVNISECTTSNVRRNPDYLKLNRRQRSSLNFRYKDIILCDVFPWILPVGLLIAYTVAAEWPENKRAETAAESGKRYLTYRIMTLYYCRIFLLTWRGGKNMKCQVRKRQGSNIKPGTYYTFPRARPHDVIIKNTITHMTNRNTRAPHPYYRVHYCIHDTSHCTTLSYAV